MRQHPLGVVIAENLRIRGGRERIYPLRSLVETSFDRCEGEREMIAGFLRATLQLGSSPCRESRGHRC